MFYDRFQHICNEAGISPSRAAIECGFNKGSVSFWKKKYENGEDVEPKLEILKSISECFGVSIDYLTGKTDIKNPPDQQSPEEIAKVALFGGDGEVTDEMWNEVKGFVEFIKDKRKRENDNN